MSVIDRFDGEYSWLSNFSQHQIIIKGLTYKTVEHFYQAQKAVTEDDFKFIFDAPTAGQAKRRGRQLTFENGRQRSDWYDINLGVMYQGLWAKFTQHPDLKIKLLETKGYDLVEGNNWGDRFWGQVDGKGENHLGRLLKKVRRDIATTYQLFNRMTGEIKTENIHVEYEGGDTWILLDDDWFPVHTPSGEYLGFFGDRKFTYEFEVDKSIYKKG